ncbi:hypothetical protein TIFTF001_002652 [Ficus carica]|uniref:Uncharacterized protein n=1 Tax=Ficus carica TaxID=3494 RepID=A0AA87ZE47_FICCA|nr:hypothetical protein TIFTF001_002652 [Ficus carica]
MRRKTENERENERRNPGKTVHTYLRPEKENGVGAPIVVMAWDFISDKERRTSERTLPPGHQYVRNSNFRGEGRIVISVRPPCPCQVGVEALKGSSWTSVLS